MACWAGDCHTRYPGELCEGDAEGLFRVPPAYDTPSCTMRGAIGEAAGLMLSRFWAATTSMP